MYFSFEDAFEIIFEKGNVCGYVGDVKHSSFLHLRYTLRKIVLCIWGKIVFFLPPKFYESHSRGHSKLPKNEPDNIP